MFNKLESNSLHIEVIWHVQGKPSVAWNNVWQKLLSLPQEKPRKTDLPDVEYQRDNYYPGEQN
jgi:hypothetical protein